MTDIVERLRAPSYWLSGSDGRVGDNAAPYEAAAEIERLLAEIRAGELRYLQASGQAADLMQKLERAAAVIEAARQRCRMGRVEFITDALAAYDERNEADEPVADSPASG